MSTIVLSLFLSSLFLFLSFVDLFCLCPHHGIWYKDSGMCYYYRAVFFFFLFFSSFFLSLLSFFLSLSLIGLAVSFCRFLPVPWYQAQRLGYVLLLFCCFFLLLLSFCLSFVDWPSCFCLSVSARLLVRLFVGVCPFRSVLSPLSPLPSLSAPVMLQ